MRNSKFLSRLAALLAILQLLLFFVSWLVNAAFPGIHVRSLLSGEGIRWFMGSFVDNLSAPLLSWLLLASMAYGSLRCALDRGKVRGRRDVGGVAFRYSFSRRMALRLVVVEIVIVAVVMFLLAFVPHAVLLNVMGNIFPSSFSDSIVAVLSFTLALCSVTYGVVCGTMRTVGDVYGSFVYGLRCLSEVLPVYVLAVEFYHSLVFVLY